MPTITPSIWFADEAEAAMRYYVSVFPNSRIVNITPYPEHIFEQVQPGMVGKVLHGEFILDGMRFLCLDGGPGVFDFTGAISFVLPCPDQEAIDYYWSKLSHVPEAEQCGWCKDQFGVSWQIVPERMGELMARPDGTVSEAASQAMLGMKKLVIADLEAARLR